ncbi:retropepsin-like aspartic protease [uncultured Clostridium sp.]|uniref:retropepsin-like aspartic protease n=1 Tax=uncultured Clostridium sp. TaxID=59620 RepID=UPI0025F1CCE1|nr:retropepsin-like aspartic protease [uncultured Clostridium sp.]
MIKLRYQDKLLFCSICIKIDDQVLNLENVLIDTGSATTLINADYITLDGTEKIRNVQGVGGYERILKKNVNTFEINNKKLNNVALSIGDMDYGIDIDLLIGLDILTALNADINLKTMELIFN